jgi:2,3-bisphosphoglycerate-independent phosphoglycerate mutase
MPPTTTPRNRPVALVILDGWGLAPDGPGNAISLANTPVMDRLLATYPTTTLTAHGEAVGLPAGQMGNSEVGHLNLGAGFVVYQWITRIDVAIADGEFAANPALLGAIDQAIASGGTLHCLGLVSDGGVHSHTRHLVAIVEMAKQRGLARLAVHAFTDGRDTAPTSGLGFLTELEADLARIGLGRIATVSGRYFAMDRDNRWDRVRKAYDAIVVGTGDRASSAAACLEAAYAAGVTDEFLPPTIIGDAQPIAPGDTVISFNYRSDRMRELVAAIAVEDFDGFARERLVAGAAPVVTMTRYEEGLPVTVAFPPRDVVNPLARVIAEAGLTQFHAAETEKYPHVTFFFNGGREEPFTGETRSLVPSPKVATYDLQPEMSAAGVTAAVVSAIDSGAFDFIVVNFANCDMVGHTGSIPATVTAVETVDAALGEILTALDRAGGVALVTADHGNADQMIDPATGGPMTAHTLNPVPVVLVAPATSPLRHARLRAGGVLAAVAPTVLDLLGVPAPADMDQPSLLA